MEKVETQITKGLTEETTEEITLLGHILENADGLKVFSELINHVISENAESILLEKKKLLAILQVEEDDLDEMMKKIIDDIIRSQIEIIEKLVVSFREHNLMQRLLNNQNNIKNEVCLNSEDIFKIT